MGVSSSAQHRRSTECEAARALLSPEALASLDALVASPSPQLPRLLLRLAHAGETLDEEALTLAVSAACNAGKDDLAACAATLLSGGGSRETLLSELLTTAAVPHSAAELAALSASTAGNDSAWARERPALLLELRAALSLPPSSAAAPPVQLSARGCPCTLLTPAFAWFLAPHLSAATKSSPVWTHLFSTESHGRSWRMLSARCSGRGPVLFVIRDDGGRLAAGFSDASMVSRAAFSGGSGSLVAALLPAARVFASTGQNANHTWFAESFTSVPNGLAFGGQVQHFGLFVDASLEAGHSRFTATYANQPLLGEGDAAGSFTLDALEAWACDNAMLQDFEAAEARARKRSASGSVLDRTADRNFMALALDSGRGNASDGHR